MTHVYVQPCDAVKEYITCLDNLNLPEDEQAVAIKHVSGYDCKDPSLGAQIDTEEGSLLFTVDNDKSMLFRRRSAHTIDVTKLSDRVDAVELLAAGLTYVYRYRQCFFFDPRAFYVYKYRCRRTF